MKTLWRRWRLHGDTARIKETEDNRSARCNVATVIGAHYFGAHDPITFWENFDPDELPSEMVALKRMGINTVFLLIPWHAFFPQADSYSLDPWYEERLHRFLQVAEQQKLAVHARLFYAHSAVDTREIVECTRQYALLTQGATAVQNLAMQAKALARSVERFSSWQQTFVTWEDFWPIFEGPPSWSAVDRHYLGGVSGFSDWIDAQGSDSLATPHGLLQQEKIWVIPEHRTPGMVLWIQFFDHLLRTRVLEPCRQAFPNVGIEVRSDAYPIPKEGETGWTWHYFDAFKDSPGPRYLYWGPFYGMVNQGEALDAATAFSGLKKLLMRFSSDGGSPLIVDQLNFTDETLQFAAHNARIVPAEIPAFLEQAALLLQQHTQGYALWTVRDYRENWLRNAAFQRALEAWQGGRQPVPGCVQLDPGETLSQVLRPVMRAQAGPAAYSDFFCEVIFPPETSSQSLTGTPLQARLDEHLWHDFESVGENRWRVCFNSSELLWDHACLQIRIPGACESSVRIKTVYFYGFVQRLHVLDETGQASRYQKAIRRMNTLLSGAVLEAES